MPRTIGAKDKRPRIRRTQLELRTRLDRLLATESMRGMASRVLDAVNAPEVMVRLITKLEAQDEHATLANMMRFLLEQHEGKAVQRINITSATLHISQDDITRARSVAQSLAQLPVASADQ